MSHQPPPALPPSIIDMVETLDEFHGAGTGLRIALKLMSSFGGLDLKVPKAVQKGHVLALALGMDDAELLCQHLAGGELYVPHGRKPRSQRGAVQELERQGRDRAQIARALGISQRHVRRLANGSSEDDTLPLFPDLE